MADEKVETTPTTEPQQAKPPLPQLIELEQLETLKLKATSMTIGKLIAEYRLGQMEMTRLQEAQKTREREVETLNQEQDHLLEEIGARLGIGPDIRRYKIDFNEGKGTLAQRPAPPVPPKG